MKNTENQPTPTLGVDIGRVIIAGDGPDTSFFGRSEAAALATPAVPGALDALARLTNAFEGRVWLVSKCGPRIQGRSLRWLEAAEFFERTGISRDRVRFCRERPEKAGICAELGVGCFIDDCADVLKAMERIVDLRILFGAPDAPAGMTPARDWPQVERLLLDYLRGARIPGASRSSGGPSRKGGGTCSVSQTPLSLRTNS